MKSRALKSAVADLFAAAPAPGIRQPPPPPVVSSPLPAASPPPASLALPISSPPPASPPPPPRQDAARPCRRHLWYAVVFPALAESERTPGILERLCLHAQRFTSWVSIEPPNALLLEIRGSVKLFGSLAALHADIDAAWSGLGLRACSSTTPSTLAALWLARAGQQAIIEDPGLLAGRLSTLSIACTSWDGALLSTLRTLGVGRLGELMRLPRDGIARRFGAARVLDLDIALAREAAPRRAFAARERFRERCDFETEAETVLYVQKALEPLIERCARFLRRRQAGVQALELRLRHRSEPLTRVRLGFASVTGDRRRLEDVSMQRLSRLELAAPVLSLELLSGRLQPLSAGSLDVFAGRGAAGGRDTAPQLVERLRARLGEKAVYGVCPVQEHRPEAAWRRVPACREHRAPSRDRLPTRRGASLEEEPHFGEVSHLGEVSRPVWLLSEPARLPDADVESLHRSRSMEEGPERIESGWWDGKDVARDYYIAREPGGARLWIFQDRRSRSWYVHGVFA